jgi:hypothetical protein
MEKKVIEIEIQDNSKSLKAQYKEAVLEVQKLADAFGATSIEVQNASKRAAELKDQIEDVNDAIQAQKGEGAFIALGKSISTVASGFSAVEGAMGLVGAESEDVQKAMLRVQSAMALAQGLEGLEDAGRAFKQLGVTVTSFGTKALSAFQAMSTASKAFLVTGIGLLIAGLGTAIAYWDDISKAIGLASNEQDTYAKQQKRINEQAKESREEVAKESASFATLIARLKATNEGSKERDKLIKDINKEYGTTLKNIKDETKFQEQLNNELASYLEYQKAKFQLQKNEEKIVKNLEVQDRLSNSIKDQKERVKVAGEIDILIKEKERLQKEIEQTGGATSNERKRVKQLQDEQLTLQKQIVSLKDKSGVSSLQQEKFALSNLNKELENANKRFEDYGRSANNASAKVDELTNSGSKYVENNKEVKTSTIDTNKELANTLESLTEKNKQFGLSEQELLLLSKLKTDALIQEQFLKSTDKDKEKQRTDALLANETDYNNQLNALNEKNRKTKEEKDKEASQKRIELEDKQFEVMQSIGQTEKEKEIADLVKSYEDKFAIIGDNAVLEKELTEQQKKDLAVIEEKYRKTQAEKDKEAQEKATQLQQQRLDLILKYTQTFGQVMSSLNGLLNANDEERLKSVKKGSKEEDSIKRKMFERDKKLRIVQTVIDTASNVVTSVRNGGGIPTGIPFGIAAATMGALQIAAISKTSYGSGDSNVTPPSTGVIAPNLNVVGNTGINQLATLQQQPVKAYVVSNDITSAQQFDLKVQQTSQL